MKIFTNTYVLYLVVFLSVTNMIGYLIMGNLNALVYFLLVGLATSFFSKNMAIILFSSLVFSNILVAAQNSTEGFTDKNRTQEKYKEEKKPSQDAKKLAQEAKKKNHISHPGKLPMTPVNDGPLEENSANSNETTETTEEAFEVGMESGTKKNDRIDYSSTIEDAYGQLNQMLRSDGMKRLTDNTQNLMKQHLQLAESMKTMGPLITNMTPAIEQTKGLMDGIGGVDMKNLGSLGSLAKNFGTSSSYTI